MSERRDDEFYVGYLPEAPSGIAARARIAIVLILAVSLALCLLLVSAQQPFGPGVFEFGVVTEFQGVVREKPYPLLLVPRPGRVGDSPAFSTYYLTVFGKRGAGALVAGKDGRAVKLSGSLVYRDDRTMIEIAAGSVEPLDQAAAARLTAVMPARPVDLGVRTLVGEIVDSKCFLGVMKPGNLKPHRSCAARCISGGVPPVLLVRDSEGHATYYLLVSESGEVVNGRVLDRVAEPVEISGRVMRNGDLLLLRADPASYRRVR